MNKMRWMAAALIENMSFVSSGGDGIVVCGRQQPPRNVTIRKCVCDDNHRQGISVTQADVPLALDVHAKAQMVVSPEQKPFSVWIAAPGGRAFSVVTCGSDASASYAPTLVDPSGKVRETRERVYAWTALTVPAADAAEGLWRLDGAAAKGYSYWLLQLDLRGVPGYLFLSSDRSWKLLK